VRPIDEDLFQAICQIAIDHGHLRTAWSGPGTTHRNSPARSGDLNPRPVRGGEAMSFRLLKESSRDSTVHRSVAIVRGSGMTTRMEMYRGHLLVIRKEANGWQAIVDETFIVASDHRTAEGALEEVRRWVNSQSPQSRRAAE